MARQWTWILGSVVTGLVVGRLGCWLKPEATAVEPESYSQPAQLVAPAQTLDDETLNYETLDDERPWPPIPTPPPPLPSPQPRPIPVPRTEGIPQTSSYRFEQGRTVNPALYQAAVDAFVEQMIGWGYDTHGILIALPDGTELASHQASEQSFGSTVMGRLTMSLRALQTWGSDPEAIALMPLLQEIHLRVGDPSLISEKILTGFDRYLTFGMAGLGNYPDRFLNQPFAAALAEVNQVQPLAPLHLVTTPESAMRTLQALRSETGTLANLLPSPSGSQLQPALDQGWATPLVVYSPQSEMEGQSGAEGHLMAGQLPDGTLFVLFNTGSSQQQIQQMQHRLLMTLTALR